MSDETKRAAHRIVQVLTEGQWSTTGSDGGECEDVPEAVQAIAELRALGGDWPTGLDKYRIITPDGETVEPTVGQATRGIRLARGLSVTAAAEAAGMRPNNWSRLESDGRGNEPSASTLRRVAQALSCSVDDLLWM